MSTPRALELAEVPAYVAFRLRMLAETPWAFLSAPDDDVGSDPAVLAGKLSEPENTLLVITGEDGGLLASAGVVRHVRRKMRHRAFIWGVYTAPEARGRGLGRAVVQAAVDTARGWPGVSIVALSVAARAEAAQRLYRSLGFAAWGTEPDALRVDGQPYDEVHMTLRL